MIGIIKGRPHKKDSKYRRFELRISDEDNKMLDEICKFTGLDRSRMVRKLIKSEHESLKFRYDSRGFDENGELNDEEFW